MKTELKRLVVTAAAGLFAIFLSVQGCSSEERAPGSSGPAGRENPSQTVSLKQMKSVSTGSMDEGGILVDMRPFDFKEGLLSVKLRANTHIGNLADYDLGALTTLRFEGREIKPSAAGELSGHHSGALMEFETGSLPEAFSITITGIRNMEERVFSWGPETGEGGEKE
jgi:hypothetical protein